MRVSSGELLLNYETLSDKARTEPIFISEGGEGRLVLISEEEYERLKRRDRRVVLTKDLTDEELERVARSEMSAHHDHLNAELDGFLDHPKA